MNVDALEELVGWPDNGNTFLASGPDGVRLAAWHPPTWARRSA